jgi:hypothetical protein
MKELKVQFNPRVHVDHATKRVHFGLHLVGELFGLSLPPLFVVNLSTDAQSAYRASSAFMTALGELEGPEPPIPVQQPPARSARRRPRE